MMRRKGDVMQQKNVTMYASEAYSKNTGACTTNSNQPHGRNNKGTNGTNWGAAVVNYLQNSPSNPIDFQNVNWGMSTF